MMKMKNILITLLMLFLGFIVTADIPRSVVSIRVTVQKPNHYSPWQMESHDILWLQGCVLGEGLILTLAHGFHHHVYVEVSKLGRKKRYPASVLLKDYDTGLALIAPEDDTFFDGLEAVELAEELPGEVDVVKWDGNGIFKTYGATLFKTAVQSYENTGAALFYHMTTTLDDGGNGEPVFLDGKLVGLSVLYDSKDKTIKVNAAATISWFLTAIADGDFSGQPVFWMDTNYIRGDENLKAFLGLEEGETGLLIHDIPPVSSGYGILKPGDVILGINGINIDDDGFCETEKFGRLNFMWILSLNSFVGDTVKMDIVRNRAPLSVEFKLLPPSGKIFLVPPYYIDDIPSYFITGGMIFQELTVAYMKAWGDDWMDETNKRFYFQYKNYWIYPTEERRRIVILNRVLPDNLNQGYHQKKNLILQSVNGTHIRDLAHLRQLTLDSTEEYIRFSFQSGGLVVFNRQELLDESAAILEKYEIPGDTNL